MKRSITMGALVALTLTPAAVGAATSTKTYTATLTGKAEVPGPGDPNGKGSAVIKIRGKQLCYDIKVRDIDGTAAGHIHKGRKGQAGDVVVALFGSASQAKRRKACVTPTSQQLKDIRANPGGFYVNVHNARFPDGALRGQLRKAKS